MSMKAHLAKLATALAEHHVGMAKSAKDGMDSCEAGSDEHEAFRKLMSTHTNTAETCTECAKAFSESMKADVGDNELDKVMPLPDGFSKIPKTDAPRAIPRYGSKEMPAQPAIDADFAHLAQIESGE